MNSVCGMSACMAVPACRVSWGAEHPSLLGRLAYPATASWRIHLAMASMRQKALSKTNAVTQIECLPKNVSVQFSSCSEYLSLSLLVKGSRDAICLRCDQGDDLLLWC